MRIALGAALIAGLGGVSARAQGVAPRLTQNQSMTPVELEALVDGVVAQAMARDHIAGVTVSVVQDGQVVLKKGYGFADVEAGRRVDPDATLFRIGSITKTFTWLMALNAVAEGRMGLDTPINGYLPAHAQIPRQSGMRQVRLRDLMVHQPGFEERLLKDLFFRDPARLQPLDDYLADHRPARIWAPGEVSAYSNYGAALAGAAVAHVGGASWEDLLETEILRPAGMNRSTGREPYPPRAGLPVPMPAALAQDLSRNYRWSGSSFIARPYEFGGFAPAASMSSTAADMARYMTLILNGGSIDGRRIYGQAAATAIRTPMLSYPGGGGADAGFFQTPLRGGLMAYGHGGGTLDFHANMMMVPDLRLGVFVAANTESGAGLTDILPSLVVSRFYQAPATPLPPSPGLMRDAGVYGGEFLSTRRPFRGLEAFVLGFRSTPVAVVAPGYLILGGDRYVPAGRPGLFSNVDNPHHQVRAVIEGGRATRLISPSGEFWRRDFLHQTRTLVLAASATALAATAVLAGLFSPARWRAPQTRAQRVAGGLRAWAAALWLLAIATFLVKAARALADQGSLVFGWPGPLMLVASGAGLAAAVLSWAAMVATPWALAGRDGWNNWRKARFTATIMAFAAFGLLLATLGALQPWNP